MYEEAAGKSSFSASCAATLAGSEVQDEKMGQKVVAYRPTPQLAGTVSAGAGIVQQSSLELFEQRRNLPGLTLFSPLVLLCSVQ